MKKLLKYIIETEKSYHIVKDEFYKLAIADYNNGVSLEYLKFILKELESVELYIECAGIKKAIDEIESKC